MPRLLKRQGRRDFDDDVQRLWKSISQGTDRDAAPARQATCGSSRLRRLCRGVIRAFKGIPETTPEAGATPEDVAFYQGRVEGLESAIRSIQREVGGKV
jgi:hypothetical protein